VRGLVGTLVSLSSEATILARRFETLNTCCFMYSYMLFHVFCRLIFVFNLFLKLINKNRYTLHGDFCDHSDLWEETASDLCKVFERATSGVV
jgi:hypothetical protein